MTLQRVILYQNGIGYFERTGHVGGDRILLPFSRHELDDVIKTLTVIDRQGAGIATVDVPVLHDKDTQITLGVKMTGGGAAAIAGAGGAAAGSDGAFGPPRRPRNNTTVTTTAPTAIPAIAATLRRRGCANESDSVSPRSPGDSGSNRESSESSVIGGAVMWRRSPVYVGAGSAGRADGIGCAVGALGAACIGGAVGVRATTGYEPGRGAGGSGGGRNEISLAGAPVVVPNSGGTGGGAVTVASNRGFTVAARRDPAGIGGGSVTARRCPVGIGGGTMLVRVPRAARVTDRGRSSCAR